MTRVKLKPRGTPFLKGHPSYLTQESLETMRRKAALRRGVPRTAEAKANMSAALKGKKLSKEHREKLAQAKIGTKQSPEQIANRVASRRGYRHSEETLQKMHMAVVRARIARGADPEVLVSLRTGTENRQWRESVFARDNWTCQYCKAKGVILHAHHIRNFSTAEDVRFSTDNGITLCKKHHCDFHKKYGIKNNTLEQLTEYLNQ